MCMCTMCMCTCVIGTKTGECLGVARSKPRFSEFLWWSLFSISVQKTAKRPNSQPSQTTKAGATTD